MKWEEASEIIKKAWEEEIETDDGGYYKEHIKKALDKKNIFLESIKRYGTPQYILDEDQLEKDALFFKKTFRKHIPNSEFFYAFKSNDLPLLIKSLKALGYKADVGSLFELKLALKLGFKKIIFTSPGKSIEELKLAIENRDKVIINIDNEDELEYIIKLIEKDKLKDKVKICIRINSDEELMQRWSKFGIKLRSLKDVISKVKNKNLKLVGIHFHCSWNDTPERHCKNIQLIGTYLKNNFSKEFLSKLEFFDLGGGIYPKDQATLLRFSYKSDLTEMIKDYSDKKAKFDPHKFYIDEVDPLHKFAKDISICLQKYIFIFNKKIKIYFEPGRYLNTNSTIILLKVIAEKENSVISDGGINLTGGFEFSEYLFAPIVNLSNPAFRLNKKIIYGPLCTPNDLWGYSFFGKDIKKNDILAILNQGSYNFSRAWRFLKGTAPYIIIKKNKLILAKEKEKFENRYAECKF